MVAQHARFDYIYIPVLVVIILFACSAKPELPINPNPASEGFDLEHSDPAAVELADSIMMSMGGRDNWDMTRYISWNFSGERDVVWDKKMDRVRITSFHDSVVYLLNLTSDDGRVQVKGKEVTDPDSLRKLIGAGADIWHHDSYWLFMPFRLKDPGVTLKYMGEDTTMTGEKCNVLQLALAQPVDAPQHKYMIYVGRADNLVKQWAYFDQASKETSEFTRPWDNYEKYGGILLSSDRSDSVGPGNVKVEERMSDQVFTEF